MATKQTTLDSDTTKPSVTQPGDGPHDTTDPAELASTITAPTPGAEAIAAGTVNGVVLRGRIPAPGKVTDPRVEEYDQLDAGGKPVHVVRNIETGETRVSRSTSTDTASTPTQSASR